MTKVQSRILIAVRDAAAWSRLYDLWLEPGWGLPGRLGIELFGGIAGTVWSYGAQDLWCSALGPESFAHQLRLRLKGDCVILADSVSAQDSGRCRIYAYLDGHEERRFAPAPLPDLETPELWLRHADIRLTDRRLLWLCGFGDTFDFIRRRSPVTERRSRMFLAFRNRDIAARFIVQRFFSENSDCPVKFSEITHISTDGTLTIEGCSVSQDRDSLQKFADNLAAELGAENFALFADAADPVRSPFWNAALILDGQAEWKERYTDLSAVSIDDPKCWMSLAHFRMTPQREAFLSDFPAAAFDFTR